MQHERNPSTAELLVSHGIPFESQSTAKGKQLILRADQTQPDSLRNLGFRLGHGTGEIQYLLYLHGRFCGVVK